MTTKRKDSSSVVGKEKKAASSNPPTTSTKSKLSITSSTEKATPNSSEKIVPNYLKPTISSLHESSCFKLPKSNTPNKATLKRRSFDKPPSPSRLPNQQQPPRQHKALVSPGPCVRSLNRCTNLPVKSIISSKPISERLSKTLREGKTVQPLITEIVKKSNPSLSTSNLKNATKSTSEATTTEVINVENEPDVKEAINEENRAVERVENQEDEVVTVSDIQPHIGNEPEQNHGHDQNLVESDQQQIQVDNEKVIPTVPEEEAKQEKIKDEHEENENTNNQEECNISESDHQEVNHSTSEEVKVKEKEEESGVIIEDHTDESNQDEEKEEVKAEISEGVKLAEGEDEHRQVESEVKEAEVVPSKPRQEDGVVRGKKDSSHISNDAIEETANKPREVRKNKVRALAGAFQTVIDHQTK